VARQPHGGFTLGVRGGTIARIQPSGGGWRVEGDPEMQDWQLRRAESAEGFVVSDGQRELGRTMIAFGIDGKSAPRQLLLDDGRLFRIRPRAPRTGGMELVGWEVPGAYLLARPDPDGWTIAPTAASGGIPDVRLLSLLFAAELLDADDSLEATAVS